MTTTAETISVETTAVVRIAVALLSCPTADSVVILPLGCRDGARCGRGPATAGVGPGSPAVTGEPDGGQEMPSEVQTDAALPTQMSPALT
jgi:hypothetical protein